MSVEQSSEPSDPHFDTRETLILKIWDRMQRIQTDFAFSQELSLYYTMPQWHDAKSVLDVGCGNGYYLRRLANEFPDKTYLGVDISSELLNIAERESLGSNVSFQMGDLFSVEGQYDCVVMRLLLQHLDDIPRVFGHLTEVIRPGGIAVVIDANDPVRVFSPALPLFTEFFSAYVARERLAGRDRDVVSRVIDAVGISPHWTMRDAMSVLIPSTIDGNLELFTETYTLLVDLVREVGDFEFDFDRVKSEWQQWSSSSNSYTQVGLHLIPVQRI